MGKRGNWFIEGEILCDDLTRTLAERLKILGIVKKIISFRSVNLYLNIGSLCVKIVASLTIELQSGALRSTSETCWIWWAGKKYFP